MEIQRILIKSLDDFESSDAKDIEQFSSKVIADVRRSPHFTYSPKSNAIAISSSRIQIQDVDDFLKIFDILEHDKVFDFIMNEQNEYEYEWLHKDNMRKVVPFGMARIAKMLISEATWSRKMDCWYIALNEPIFGEDRWYIL